MGADAAPAGSSFKLGSANGSKKMAAQPSGVSRLRAWRPISRFCSGLSNASPDHSASPSPVINNQSAHIASRRAASAHSSASAAQVANSCQASAPVWYVWPTKASSPPSASVASSNKAVRPRGQASAATLLTSTAASSKCSLKVRV